MATSWKLRIGILIAFVLSAGIAATPWMQSANRAVSGVLRPMGVHIPELQLIWVFGGIPVTFLTVLGVAWHRNRHQKPWIGIVLGFMVGSLIELLSKHFIALPTPPNVPPEGFYQAIVNATNISPGQVLHLFSLVMGHGTTGVSHFKLLQGSFPSGHLFRLTYTLLVLTQNSKPGVVVAVADVLASICVVATGGHWVWDAVGGILLATGIASWMAFPSLPNGPSGQLSHYLSPRDH